MERNPDIQRARPTVQPCTYRLLLYSSPCVFILTLPLYFLRHLSLSGIRIVAGAVGTLSSILDSEQLSTALGGIEDSAPDDQDKETVRTRTHVFFLPFWLE